VEQLPDSSDNQRPVKTCRYYDPIGYFVTTEEKSVKKRDPYFSNLKFILIFLVILGHLMEKHIYTNHDLYIIYTAIYMVHMPLFAFISGYFSKNSHKKLNHVWKIGGQYLLLHLGRLLVNLLITGENRGNWRLEIPLLVFLVPIEPFWLEVDGNIYTIYKEICRSENDWNIQAIYCYCNYNNWMFFRRFMVDWQSLFFVADLGVLSFLLYGTLLFK
jgi:hypothetical protein